MRPSFPRVSRASLIRTRCNTVVTVPTRTPLPLRSSLAAFAASALLAPLRRFTTHTSTLHTSSTVPDMSNGIAPENSFDLIGTKHSEAAAVQRQSDSRSNGAVWQIAASASNVVEWRHSHGACLLLTVVASSVALCDSDRRRQRRFGLRPTRGQLWRASGHRRGGKTRRNLRQRWMVRCKQNKQQRFALTAASDCEQVSTLSRLCSLRCSALSVSRQRSQEGDVERLDGCRGDA